MARMYASQAAACSPERGVRASFGAAAPKMSAQKSPGKNFNKLTTNRNAVAQMPTQMTTLVGSGVRKQQFAKSPA